MFMSAKDSGLPMSSCDKNNNNAHRPDDGGDAMIITDDLVRVSSQCCGRRYEKSD